MSPLSPAEQQHEMMANDAASVVPGRQPFIIAFPASCYIISIVLTTEASSDLEPILQKRKVTHKK